MRVYHVHVGIHSSHCLLIISTTNPIQRFAMRASESIYSVCIFRITI